MKAASLSIGLCALVSAMIWAAPGHAQQLYKWTDANGRVQYSDRKPPDGKQAVEVRNTVSSVGSQQGYKAAAEAEKEFQKRREQQAETAQKQEQTALQDKQKAESCDAARRNLAALRSGQRIERYNMNGERSYLSDADRPREVQRNQQLVEQNCK